VDDAPHQNLFLNDCDENSTSQRFFFNRERIKAVKEIVDNTCMDQGDTGRVYMGTCDPRNKAQTWRWQENKPGQSKGGKGTLEKYSEQCSTEDPPETQRSYSSVYGGDAPGVGHARSTLASQDGWTAEYSYPGEYIQMDLGTRKDIGGVVLLGRKDKSEWVSGYKVLTTSDPSLKSWTEIQGVFDGNSDSSTKVYGTFKPILARFVRIVVTHWNQHLATRAGLLVCRNPLAAAALSEINASSTTEPFKKMASGCYVHARECPKQTISFKTWTRDYWGEMNRNASLDEDACLETRKREHQAFCGSEDIQMKFIPQEVKEL
jgi:hypothetical protein